MDLAEVLEIVRSLDILSVTRSVPVVNTVALVDARTAGYGFTVPGQHDAIVAVFGGQFALVATRVGFGVSTHGDAGVVAPGLGGWIVVVLQCDFGFEVAGFAASAQTAARGLADVNGLVCVPVVRGLGVFKGVGTSRGPTVASGIRTSDTFY